MKENKNKSSKIAFLYRGSWYHRKKEMREDGTIKYGKQGGFKTPEEAEENYFKTEKEFEEARKKMILPVVDKEIMLNDYLVYWFEKLYVRKVNNNTAVIGSYTIYNLIIPNLPYNIKLKLTTTEYIDILLEKIDKLGKSLANKAREYLHSVFEDARLKDKLINVNPVKNAKQYKRNKTKITILSKEEIKLLLENSFSSSWYLEILLSLFCGLRKGEIRGLKFEDFDIENGTITISRQLSRQIRLDKNQFKVEYLKNVERPPKTNNSYRTMKVPKIIIDEYNKRKNKIESDKMKAKNYNDNHYICCNEFGNPRHEASFNSYLTKLCSLISIPKITVHGLRHMYATILIEQGVELAKISALLGHSSVNTTFEIYCDIMEEKKKITAFLNNQFSVEDGEKDE